MDFPVSEEVQARGLVNVKNFVEEFFSPGGSYRTVHECPLGQGECNVGARSGPSGRLQQISLVFPAHLFLFLSLVRSSPSLPASLPLSLSLALSLSHCLCRSRGSPLRADGC